MVNVRQNNVKIPYVRYRKNNVAYVLCSLSYVGYGRTLGVVVRPKPLYVLGY